MYIFHLHAVVFHGYIFNLHEKAFSILIFYSLLGKNVVHIKLTNSTCSKAR